MNSTQNIRQSHRTMQRNQTIDKALFLQGAECVRILCKRKKTIKPIKECINLHMRKGDGLNFHCQC